VSVQRQIWCTVLLALALLPSAWIAGRFRDMPHFGRFDDDGVYVVCARSLAEGGGYRIASLPDQPFETKYPPLFPALVAGIWKLDPHFPENLRWIVLLGWCSLAGAVYLSFAWFRRLGFGDGAAVAMAALIAVNPVAIFFGVSAMSEMLFTALLVGCLLALDRETISPGVAAAAGLIASAAYLCRTAALPLLVTVPLCLLLRRRARAAAGFAAGFLPSIFGWTWWAAAHRVHTTDPTLLFHTDYFGQILYGFRWAELPATLSYNARMLVASAGRLVLFGRADTDPASYWVSLVGMVVVVCAIAALWRERRRPPFGLTFALAYCGVLLLWWTPPNERFLLPVYPILLAAIASEFRRFTAQLPAHGAARFVPACGVAALLAANIFSSGHAIPRIIEADASDLAARRAAYEWIDRNAPADARLYAYFDTELYLYTHRQATLLHLLGNPAGANIPARVSALERLPDFARRKGLSLAMITRDDFVRDVPPAEARAVRRALVRNPALEPVYQTAAVGIYRLRNVTPILVQSGFHEPRTLGR
jgi:hypothetical protein